MLYVHDNLNVAWCALRTDFSNLYIDGAWNAHCLFIALCHLRQQFVACASVFRIKLLGGSMMKKVMFAALTIIGFMASIVYADGQYSNGCANIAGDKMSSSVVAINYEVRASTKPAKKPSQPNRQKKIRVWVG